MPTDIEKIEDLLGISPKYISWWLDKKTREEVSAFGDFKLEVKVLFPKKSGACGWWIYNMAKKNLLVRAGYANNIYDAKEKARRTLTGLLS